MFGTSHLVVVESWRFCRIKRRNILLLLLLREEFLPLVLKDDRLTGEQLSGKNESGLASDRWHWRRRSHLSIAVFKSDKGLLLLLLLLLLLFLLCELMLYLLLLLLSQLMLLLSFVSVRSSIAPLLSYDWFVRQHRRLSDSSQVIVLCQGVAEASENVLSSLMLPGSVESGILLTLFRRQHLDVVLHRNFWLVSRRRRSVRRDFSRFRQRCDRRHRLTLQRLLEDVSDDVALEGEVLDVGLQRSEA